MNPVIQATVALTFAQGVGVVLGYHLRKYTHACPEPPPLLHVPAGGKARLLVEGPCELGRRMVDVHPRGHFEILVQGEGCSLLPDEHDAAGTTFKSGDDPK